MRGSLSTFTTFARWAVLTALLTLMPYLLLSVHATDVAGADGREDTVLLVHGLNPLGGLGWPCPIIWRPMQEELAELGWDRGRILGVKYYNADSGCETTLDDHGDHLAHAGTRENHAVVNPSSHSADTPVEHLGYHLAWTIYNNYTAKGQNVKLVGHSLGALIVRSMLSEQEAGHPDFPPELYVDQTVSLAGPHNGSWLAPLCGFSYQCRQIEPNSDFLLSLGQNPQATGGTDWSAIGAYLDPLVAAESAVYMHAPHRYKYAYPLYEHLLPLWDRVPRWDGAFDRSEYLDEWLRHSGQPRPLRLVDLALASPKY